MRRKTEKQKKQQRRSQSVYLAVYFRVSADVVGTRSSQLDARSEHQTRVAMGVCLSKPSESSPLVDAGGSAASRLESSRGGVVESFVDAQPLTALAERLRAGDRVAVDDYVATSEDERVPQRRKIDAGHSVAMNTGASGSNPPMLSGRYASRTPRVRLAFPAFFVIY